MSNGALVQLNATGSQNDYINKNPEITFFKYVYKRYTNFGIENIELNFNSQCDFGGIYNCQILHNADLISKMYLRMNIPEYKSEKYKWAWISNLGHFIIDYYSIDIGGVIIDKQLGRWLDIWYELTKNIGLDLAYNEMIGNTENMLKMSNYHPSKDLWIPFKFWFNRFNSCAIPIISLKYQDIYVTIKLNSLNNCLIYERGLDINKMDIKINNCSLFVDYIYLDNLERKKFSELNHEYIIEQIQFNGVEPYNKSIKMTFSHPCKAIYWFAQLDRWINNEYYLGYNSELIKDNDDSLLKIIATKRLILSLAEYSDDGYLILNMDENQYNLKPYNNIYKLLFDRIKPIGIEQIPIIDNIIISGELLTDEEISTPIEYLEFNLDNEKIKFNRNNEIYLFRSEGSSNYDVNIKLWNNYNKYINKKGLIIDEYAISINNYYIQSFIDYQFYNYLQPYQFFSNIPSNNLNTYSFSLYPEDLQPSGTINFSKIDEANLHLKINNNINNYLYKGESVLIYIFASNYNIFRIISGIGGIVFIY